MKHYQFNYKVPIVVMGGVGPTSSEFEIKFLQIAAVDMWEAIDKVKAIYEDYKKVFDLTSIIEMP